MKRIIATIAIALTVGLLGAHVANARWGGYGPMHYGSYGAGADEQTIAAQNAFITETAELRKSIATKRIDLMTELAKDPADTDAVNTLRSELNDLQEELNTKAADSGAGYGYGMMGYNMMASGYGSCWTNPSTN